MPPALPSPARAGREERDPSSQWDRKPIAKCEPNAGRRSAISGTIQRHTSNTCSYLRCGSRFALQDGGGVMAEFKWLHLSDWHQGKENFDRSLVLEKLLL